MSPLSVNLSDLVASIDTDLADAAPLAKITEAQLRSRTLNALGDQLVGYYVAQARQDNASWTDIGDAIGVSKQAAQQRWVPQLFDDFTDRARHVVVLAQDVAHSHRHAYISTEHLLGEPAGLASKLLLAKAGLADVVRRAVADRMAEDGKKTPRGHLPFTPQGKQALKETIREAAGLGHDFVGTEHLLLGLLAVQDGIAAAALGALGFDLDTTRQLVAAEVAALLRQNKETS